MKVWISQHNIDMNIDHLINALFQTTSIKINGYNQVQKRILLSERVDVTVQYRYEHRSFHQSVILGYVY